MTRYFSPTRHGIPLFAIAMISFAGWSIAAKHTSREVMPLQRTAMDGSVIAISL